MTMLSDRDLFVLAKKGDFISPFDRANCEGATINLTLDHVVRKYSSEEPIVLGKEVTDDLYSYIDLSKDHFWLQPHESILIQTYEYIKVPDYLTARIYERYSVKSLGLMISPAHYMNPGFRGKVGLLAVNHAPVPIKLIPGIKICQLGLFELSSEPLKPYELQDAKYMDATDISISKLHLDKEIQEYLQSKGIGKVSDEMAKELGEHLMRHVRKSAKKLADLLRQEEGSSENE